MKPKHSNQDHANGKKDCRTVWHAHKKKKKTKKPNEKNPEFKITKSPKFLYVWVASAT